MFQSVALLEYHPEHDPDVVFASLPAGPRTRRRGGAEIETQKSRLRIIAFTEAGFDASTGLTSASGVSIFAFLSPSSVAY